MAAMRQKTRRVSWIPFYCVFRMAQRQVSAAERFTGIFGQWITIKIVSNNALYAVFDTLLRLIKR